MTTVDSSTESNVPSARMKTGLSLVEVIVILVIIGILVALLLPATRTSGPATKRSQCKNNLKQIALALHNYADEWEAFPPAYTVDADGKPLHSWRTLILPYLEQKTLYNTIDLSKPWDDPVNAQASRTVIPFYQCPTSHLSPGHTTYLGIAGPDFLFHPTEPREFADITDGMSHTWMVVEVNPKRSVPWMAPSDADEELIQSLLPKSELPHQGGFQASNADGSVRYFSADMSAAERRARMTIAGNDQADVNED